MRIYIGPEKAKKTETISQSDVINLIYPVGALYMSTASTTPATLFPGTTWAQIKDRFILSAGDMYNSGATGGAASQSYTPAGSVGGHTLTTQEIPSHNHTFTGSTVTSTGQSVDHTHYGPSHTHTIDSHTHNLNNHTHSIPALSGSTNLAGSHIHNVPVYYGSTPSGTSSTERQFSGRDDAWLTALGGESSYAGAHSHTVTTVENTTGAPSNNNTGGSGALTAKAAGNGLTSGVTSDHTHNVTVAGTVGNTGGGGSHNHGFTGTAATINTVPPYFAVYVWRRTA